MADSRLEAAAVESSAGVSAAAAGGAACGADGGALAEVETVGEAVEVAVAVADDEAVDVAEAVDVPLALVLALAVELDVAVAEAEAGAGGQFGVHESATIPSAPSSRALPPSPGCCCTGAWNRLVILNPEPPVLNSSIVPLAVMQVLPGPPTTSDPGPPAPPPPPA